MSSFPCRAGTETAFVPYGETGDDDDKVEIISPSIPVSYTHLDVYKRQEVTDGS